MKNLKIKLIFILFKIIGQCSLKHLYRLAQFMNVLLLPFPLKFKRIIRINVNRCLPELASTERQQIIRTNIFQTILRMLEMAFFWFAPQKKIAALFWDIRGETEFGQHMQQAHGVIALVPHLGAWESVNYYIGSHYPAVSLYKPQKTVYQNHLLKLARERFGVQMFPANVSGIKNILLALRAKQCAGILPDHDPGDNGGLFAPFFGIPSNTTTLIAKLAAKSQAAVYFVVGERLSKGRGFRLHFIPGHDDLKHPDLVCAATTLNTQLAEIIRRFPEQYEWSYKRFRRTPWNAQGFYDDADQHTTSAQNVRVVGLIGGIATGKSTAAHFFKDHGIEVIDTDLIARELTIKDSSVLKKIVAHFGDTILTADRELDRALLRTIIFKDAAARAWLENLLHPLIRTEVQKRVAAAKTPYCVVAIPLLKRRADYPFLQKILYVRSSQEKQTERLMARDHISREAALAIIAAQPKSEVFSNIADVIIENDADEIHLQQQLSGLHAQWQKAFYTTRE
jgi:KDO2-lipid IV(A) lauroyltransferase